MSAGRSHSLCVFNLFTCTADDIIPLIVIITNDCSKPDAMISKSGRTLLHESAKGGLHMCALK